MILNPVYNLPEIHFVGGSTQELIFNLVTPNGDKFDANNCTVVFSLINFTNKNGVPILTKNAVLKTDSDGITNIAVVELTPQDTVHLHERFIYQISVRDGVGEIEIPGQGLFDIIRNIHQSFIT